MCIVRVLGGIDSNDFWNKKAISTSMSTMRAISQLKSQFISLNSFTSDMKQYYLQDKIFEVVASLCLPSFRMIP